MISILLGIAQEIDPSLAWRDTDQGEGGRLRPESLADIFKQVVGRVPGCPYHNFLVLMS